MKTKTNLVKCLRQESGQALLIVLALLLLGSLTLPPLLSFMGTANKSGQVYKNKTNELYTADSGIEDGLWRIKYDFMGVNYNPYDFETTWPYQTNEINGMAANFTIKNVWFPSDFTLDDWQDVGLTPDTAREMIESEKLVVTGTAGAIPGNPYSIKIDFTPDAGDNLTVKSLGVWLPQGFEYAPDSCSLQDDGPFTEYCPDSITVSEAPGGQTVVWSYDENYPLYSSFPDVVSSNATMTLDFTFRYKPPAEHPNWLPVAIAWITTDMDPTCMNLDDVPVSWDVDSRFYKIVSKASNTEVEAYSSKNELRQMGDAMSGDYIAIGNSLLADDNHDNYRETWHTPSSFTLNSVPSDADVAYAYLYWSGWRNDDAKQNLVNDDGSSFSNWVRSSDDVIQTSAPIGPGDGSGTWNPTPASPTTCWDKVDETPPNDITDYITCTTTGGGYKLFTFSSFSIPSSATISNVTVYVRAKKASSSSGGNVRAALKINGGSNPYYSWATSTSLTTSWTTYSYSCTTNPKTGLAWTSSDLNSPTSANGLQQFGVYSTNSNPNIQVTQVYATVTYCESRWSLSASPTGRFQGQGIASATTAQRTLTLKNSLNLSSYAPTTVVVYWDQYGSGNLEDTDALYFAFSGDGGSTWSSNIEAFHGNPPTGEYYRFTYPIPKDYLTNDFKMRLYFNFDDPNEYVQLDNIKIIYMPPDTSITFKIGNDQVYFNGSEPAVGAQPLTAGRTYAMFNSMWGVPEGFSYACVRDVTKLVQKYPVVPGEEHHTGNAVYTVGDVSADKYKTGTTLSNFAFAGWSLIVVYASPQTAGHYIYIRDNNFAFHPGTGGDLDFDDDPTYPGGVITNFVVPNPITDKNGNVIETEAAKLTCFVVEGDNFGTSSIEVTGEQSGLSMDLWNPASPSPDVFNGKSYPGTFNEGVDIDTFEVKWSDGILTPKDKKLYVDLYSYNDAWNLVYFIISIRSKTVTSGTTHYVINSG